MKDNSSTLIIGGGIQGLETAWILSQMEQKITLSHHSERLMRRFLDEKSSKILEKAIKSHGVSIFFNTAVNEKMETNIPDIFAVGDVAQYNNSTPGLWNIAIGQSKVAGYNMIGKDTIYDTITPVTTLNAFGISLFSMGIVDETKTTHIILDDRSSDDIYNKVFINNNKIIGAIAVGSIRSSPALKSAIEKEINIKDIDYTNISFDDFIEELKSLSKKQL